jgi:hypothetical protein
VNIKMVKPLVVRRLCPGDVHMDSDHTPAVIVTLDCSQHHCQSSHWTIGPGDCVQK